jgi:hypothetical protein
MKSEGVLVFRTFRLELEVMRLELSRCQLYGSNEKKLRRLPGGLGKQPWTNGTDVDLIRDMTVDESCGDPGAATCPSAAVVVTVRELSVMADHSHIDVSRSN